jgi:chromosome segregation ATPase
VSTTTVEEQLVRIRKRIDELQASGDVPRLRRHLDVLEDVEQRLAQLRTRLDVAERSLTADVSGNWTTFAAAVEDELESWDTYLERLQATVATRASHAREEAEAAIGDVRSRRIEVARLTEVHDTAANGWEADKERVSAARDELAREADELSAKLN